MSERLAAQLDFLTEADRLKTVLRANVLADASRRENSAEHSWHIALYALVLADQAGPGVSIDRVIRMLLLHDLVEIDVGDTPIHGAHDPAAIEAAEAAAAERIFGLLPADQRRVLLALWHEFEAGESADAMFARSIDRVQPVMQNLASGGGTWRDYAVTSDQLDTRVGTKIARGAPRLWDHVRALTRRYFEAAAD